MSGISGYLTKRIPSPRRGASYILSHIIMAVFKGMHDVRLV